MNKFKKFLNLFLLLSLFFGMAPPALNTAPADAATVLVDGYKYSSATTSVKLSAEGDSNTYWNGTHGYPNVGGAAVGAPYSVTVNNFATWGITTTTMLSDYSTRIGASFDATKNINLLSITGGANDGVNTATRQIYINIRNMIRKARLETGYQRVVLSTVISRGETGFSPPNNGTYDGNTLPLNVHFRNYWNNDLDADALADFAADSHFDTSADTANATYYSDLTHASTAGHAILGGIAATAYTNALTAPATRTNAPMTWSLFDKSGYIGLSNSDRTVKWNTTGFNWASTRGFPGKCTGKWYFEMVVDDASYVQVGITNYSYFNAGGNGGQTAAYLQETANSLGAGHGGTNGNLYYNNSSLTTQPGFSNGDVIRFAMDMDNKRLWYSKIGQNWNGSGTADPATNTGGVDITGLGTCPYYPAVQIFADFGSDLGQVTARFASSQQSGTKPSGFLALDQ